MKVRAKLNNLRIAPRKVRLIADAIRGEQALKARSILNFSIKKGAEPLKKLLDSAISNAKNNFNLDDKELFISEIRVDEGAKLKRWRAISRGRANPIQKKTSHITLILSEYKAEENKEKEKEKKGDEKEKKAERKKGKAEKAKVSGKKDVKIKKKASEKSKKGGNKK